MFFFYILNVLSIKQMLTIFIESSFSKSRCLLMCLYVYIYMSPHHVIVSEASHRPSDHLISSRPLIGQPSLGMKKKNVTSPFSSGGGKKSIGATIRIGQEILTYADFF